MELVLSDGLTSEPKQVIQSRYCFNVFVKSIDDNDVIANNLLSEITGGPGEPSQLMIIICPYVNQGDYKLILADRLLSNCNVMKNLRERFQDRVVLSVEIHSKRISPAEDTESNSDSDSSDESGEDVDEAEGTSADFNYCCLSSKGMIINPERFNSVAHSSCMTQFDWNGLSKSSLFRIRLVAHVYDPNLYLPVPMMTNQKILEDSVASDVVIIADNGEEIKGHKCFLISTSSVFQRMLESEMEESKTGHIDMTDISEKGIRAFLRFIYQGHVIGREDNIDVAYDVLYAAHKYDVPKLEEMMMNHLLGRQDVEFSPTFAFKIYSFVRGIESASELKEKVVRIMSMNFNELEEVPEFKEVFQKNPNDALEFCRSLAMVKRKLDSDESRPRKKCKCLEIKENE